MVRQLCGGFSYNKIVRNIIAYADEFRDFCGGQAQDQEGNEEQRPLLHRCPLGRPAPKNCGAVT
jgi:hypothetical protein